MKVLENIPEEIDYNEFKWLRKGDLPKVRERAGKLGCNVTLSMVRHTLKKRAFNIDVLVAAQMVVNDKKKRILELQLQSKQLSQAIQLKIA